MRTEQEIRNEYSLALERREEAYKKKDMEAYKIEAAICSSLSWVLSNS